MKTDYTCVIAASYEAKEFGIKTGTAVWQAKKLCQSLRLVEARPELYVKLHHRILAAIDTCIPIKAVHSIDECACELLGDERQPDGARRTALAVKTAIHDRIGPAMRCSIDLAKVAADMHKPDGLTVIEQHEIPQRLYDLKLDDLSGIGGQMLRRLVQAGIRTVEDLYGQTEQQLKGIWNSVLGQRMYGLIRGENLPLPLIVRRSVGHSYVLPPDLRTVDGVHGVLMRLIHKAAARMRYLRLWTRRLDVQIEIMRGQAWSAHINMEPCQDTLTILEAFAKIWRPPQVEPIRAGIVLGKCIHDAFVAAPLFACERRRIEISRVLDRINNRYGKNAIYFGGMHAARDSAPMRISFTTIPELDRPW
jgi:DNA polymerase-4